MAVTYGFFDSLNHDRVYTAEQFASIFDGLITDGIYKNVGDAFAVTPGSGMEVLVGVGRAWLSHTWTLNDATIPLAISPIQFSGAGSRIDAVIIEVDKSIGVRANSIKVLEGTAASDPVKPVMTNTDTLKQYPLCYVTVGTDTSAITADMIEDVRETETGIVRAIVGVTASDYDVEEMHRQIRNTWKKSELQFTTADEGTTLNITVNETVSE